MFQALAGWLSAFFTSTLTAIYNAVCDTCNTLHRFFNGWIWLISAICVVVAMFYNVFLWIESFLNQVYPIFTGGVTGPFQNSVTFNAMYGFVDYIFPLHETVSAFIVLMPLYLLVNTLRLLKAIISLFPTVSN